jgi:predicted RNase H-like nuclease (RuvC/YqgF family)
MFKRNHIKMNKVEDNAGGGAGGASDQNDGLPESLIALRAKEAQEKDNAENKDEDAGSAEESGVSDEGKQDQINEEAYQKLKEEREALIAKKEEILSEKKALQKKLKEIESSQTQDKLKKAEESGDLQAKIEILEAEIAKEKEVAENYQEKWESMSTKLLMQAKQQAFLKELGADITNAKHLQHVNWNKFVLNDDQATFDDKGVKQAVQEFRENFPECIKSNQSSGLDQTSAQPKTTSKDLSFKERAKKAGISL